MEKDGLEANSEGMLYFGYYAICLICCYHIPIISIISK